MSISHSHANNLMMVMQLKSQEEFDTKMKRGGGGGNKRTMEFFDIIEREAIHSCTDAVKYGRH